MDMEQSGAIVLDDSQDGMLICAASARISTQKGSALSVAERTRTAQNNTALIRKVLSSGHQSLIEHKTFHLAFHQVSVFCEQFIIEFRLASFTVQSRRYVDFTDTGFYTPPQLPPALQTQYNAHMSGLFDTYSKLLGLGIPKEDARFVLPYCLKSNFYCTCNARELLHIICTMLYGRGRFNPELVSLGTMLKDQFDAYFPGTIDAQKEQYEQLCDRSCSYDTISANDVSTSNPVVSYTVELLAATPDGEQLIRDCTPYTHPIQKDPNLTKLAARQRPRELELLQFTYKICDFSLSGITHLTRHRMQSVLIPALINAPLRARHILPAGIGADPAALELYTAAFSRTSTVMRQLLEQGMPKELMVYFALSGHTLDVITSMNARELMLFFKLRTCQRAQWEIRGIATHMLRFARAYSPALFGGAGPGCYLLGYCPEGRMCCGKTEQIKAQFRTL